MGSHLRVLLDKKSDIWKLRIAISHRGPKLSELASVVRAAAAGLTGGADGRPERNQYERVYVVDSTG